MELPAVLFEKLSRSSVMPDKSLAVADDHVSACASEIVMMDGCACQPVAIDGATILQFERFRIDISDSALTGRTP